MEWFFHTIPHATRLLPQERIAETQRSLKDFVSQHGGDKDLLLLAEKPSSRPLLNALIQDDEALFRLVDQVFQSNEAWIFQKGVQLLFTALSYKIKSGCFEPKRTLKWKHLYDQLNHLQDSFSDVERGSFRFENGSQLGLVFTLSKVVRKLTKFFEPSALEEIVKLVRDELRDQSMTSSFRHMHVLFSILPINRESWRTLFDLSIELLPISFESSLWFANCLQLTMKSLKYAFTHEIRHVLQHDASNLLLNKDLVNQVLSKPILNTIFESIHRLGTAPHYSHLIFLKSYTQRNPVVVSKLFGSLFGLLLSDNHEQGDTVFACWNRILRSVAITAHPKSKKNCSNTLAMIAQAAYILGRRVQHAARLVALDKAKSTSFADQSSWSVSQDLIDRFIGTTLPIVISRLGTQNDQSSADVTKALRCISILNPKKTFDALFEYIKLQLDDPKSAQQIDSGLSASAQINPLLFDPEVAPEGPRLIVQFLFSFLPFVSANREQSLKMVLQIYSLVLSRIPLFESPDDASDSTYATPAEEQWRSEARQITYSGELLDWTGQLFESLFVVLLNLEDEEKDSSSSSGQNNSYHQKDQVFDSVSGLFFTIFNQSSKSLFVRWLNVLLDKFLDNPSSSKLARVISFVGSVRPHTFLQIVLQAAEKRLFGKDFSKFSSSLSDKEITNWITCLNVSQLSRPLSLFEGTFLPRIQRITNLGLVHKEVDVQEAASKLVAHLIILLSLPCPSNFRFVDGSIWSVSEDAHETDGGPITSASWDQWLIFSTSLGSSLSTKSTDVFTFHFDPATNRNEIPVPQITWNLASPSSISIAVSLLDTLFTVVSERTQKLSKAPAPKAASASSSSSSSDDEMSARTNVIGLVKLLTVIRGSLTGLLQSKTEALPLRHQPCSWFPGKQLGYEQQKKIIEQYMEASEKLFETALKQFPNDADLLKTLVGAAWSTRDWEQHPMTDISPSFNYMMILVARLPWLTPTALPATVFTVRALDIWGARTHTTNRFYEAEKQAQSQLLQFMGSPFVIVRKAAAQRMYFVVRALNVPDFVERYIADWNLLDDFNTKIELHPGLDDRLLGLMDYLDIKNNKQTSCRSWKDIKRSVTFLVSLVRLEKEPNLLAALLRFLLKLQSPSANDTDRISIIDESLFAGLKLPAEKDAVDSKEKLEEYHKVIIWLISKLQTDVHWKIELILSSVLTYISPQIWNLPKLGAKGVETLENLTDVVFTSLLKKSLSAIQQTIYKELLHQILKPLSVETRNEYKRGDHVSRVHFSQALPLPQNPEQWDLVPFTDTPGQFIRLFQLATRSGSVDADSASSKMKDDEDDEAISDPKLFEPKKVDYRHVDEETKQRLQTKVKQYVLNVNTVQDLIQNFSNFDRATSSNGTSPSVMAMTALGNEIFQKLRSVFLESIPKVTPHLFSLMVSVLQAEELLGLWKQIRPFLGASLTKLSGPFRISEAFSTDGSAKSESGSAATERNDETEKLTITSLDFLVAVIKTTAMKHDFATNAALWKGNGAQSDADGFSVGELLMKAVVSQDVSFWSQSFHFIFINIDPRRLPFLWEMLLGLQNGLDRGALGALKSVRLTLIQRKRLLEWTIDALNWFGMRLNFISFSTDASATPVSTMVWLLQTLQFNDYEVLKWVCESDPLAETSSISGRLFGLASGSLSGFPGAPVDIPLAVRTFADCYKSLSQWIISLNDDQSSSSSSSSSSSMVDIEDASAGSKQLQRLTRRVIVLLSSLINTTFSFDIKYREEVLGHVLEPTLSLISLRVDEPQCQSSLKNALGSLSASLLSLPSLDNFVSALLVFVIKQQQLEKDEPSDEKDGEGGKAGAATNSKWRSRKVVFQVLRKIKSKLTLVLDYPQRSAVVDLLTQLLVDPSAELRQLAVNKIASVVNSLDDKEVASLLDSVHKKLSETRHIRGNTKTARGTVDAKQIELKNQTILLASAVVLSTPYDVPQWLPKLLQEFVLQYRFVGSSVQETINKTLREFKRTHQDSWFFQQHLFSREELDDIQSISASQSYFA